ncbi:hypothetical protein L7F22_040465 [Adiantum nelumboides]|nr:hypothetical protein [Adiantum nelumboides]
MHSSLPLSFFPNIGQLTKFPSCVDSLSTRARRPLLSSRASASLPISARKKAAVQARKRAESDQARVGRPKIGGEFELLMPTPVRTGRRRRGSSAAAKGGGTESHGRGSQGELQPRLLWLYQL